MVKYEKICPKCKGNDISKDLSLNSYGKGDFFNSFICNNCGYSGQFFPEIEK